MGMRRAADGNRRKLSGSWQWLEAIELADETTETFMLPPPIEKGNGSSAEESGTKISCLILDRVGVYRTETKRTRVYLCNACHNVHHRSHINFTHFAASAANARVTLVAD